MAYTCNQFKKITAYDIIVVDLNFSVINDNMETSQNMFSFISFVIHSEILDASGCDQKYDEYCMTRMHFNRVYSF